MSICESTGQNTGSAAHIVATSTSRAARTIGVGPYQVGSNVGEVAARVSTIEARRQMEKILALGNISGDRTYPAYINLHAADAEETNQSPS